MDILIGQRSLSATRPDDLDAKLVDLTGCNADEIVAMLSNPARIATPLMIAKALQPLMAEPVATADLAQMIAEDDPTAVRQQVLAIYRGDQAPPAALPAPETASAPAGEATGEAEHG